MGISSSTSDPQVREYSTSPSMSSSISETSLPLDWLASRRLAPRWVPNVEPPAVAVAADWGMLQSNFPQLPQGSLVQTPSAPGHDCQSLRHKIYLGPFLGRGGIRSWPLQSVSTVLTEGYTTVHPTSTSPYLCLAIYTAAQTSSL